MSAIVYLVVGIVLGVAVFFIVKKINSGADKDQLDRIKLELGSEFHKLSEAALNNANEQLIRMARERLGVDKEEVRTELENKKIVISNLVDEIRKDLLHSQQRLQKSDEERVASFSALQRELETYKQVTSDLRGTTEDLKKVLSNNQTRGQFGEQVAENLMRMAGFVVGQDYVCNKAQDSVKSRPDFTVFLPDKTKINIDVKFPYAALIRSTETDNKEEKMKYINQFRIDVKNKIKQVTTRDYISPEEKTVDFVILFIPNEMIFSFIYDQLNDVFEEAMRKKVVLAGPFSFTAILRLVKQAYTNFKYQENLHQVIGHIKEFKNQFDKYSEAVDDLGKKLTTAVKQYEEVSSVRTRQLTRIVDKIEGHETAAVEEGKLIE